MNNYFAFKNNILKICPKCGFDVCIDLDDTLYPLNRERTIWNVVCNEVYGGCGFEFLGVSKIDVVERWNKL